MRDILSEATGSNPGPVKVAGQSARSQLPKRFYERAEAIEADGMFELRLDGRSARTPGRSILATRSRRIGEALAKEWDAQVERIDPQTMPLTRILNSAIDGVAPRMEEVRADVLAFAGSDLLCYRADDPPRLAERQAAMWDPILERFARDDAPFTLATGVMPVSQSAQTLSRIDAMLAGVNDASALAALHVTTTITGSALLALALRFGWIAEDEGWNAAHVDEDWNRELWGDDEEAALVRVKRRRDYDAATFILLDR